MPVLTWGYMRYMLYDVEVCASAREYYKSAFFSAPRIDDFLDFEMWFHAPNNNITRKLMRSP